MRMGGAPEKMTASGGASLLRDMSRSVASLRASSLLPLVFILRFPFFVSVYLFAFFEASTSKTYFPQKKK